VRVARTFRCTSAVTEDAEDSEDADGAVLWTHTGPQKCEEALACVAMVDYGHAAPERNAAIERCTTATLRRSATPRPSGVFGSSPGVQVAAQEVRPRGFATAEDEVGPLEAKLNAYPEIIGIATQWSKSRDDLMGAGMWMGKLGAPTPMQRASSPSSLTTRSSSPSSC